jgi:N-acetylglucosamine-6-phosphate deacetylase
MKFANWNLQQAVRLATSNPAQASKLEPTAGQLVPGAVADIVALTANGEVRQTIVRGQIT